MCWLARTSVPLFVSRVRLKGRRKLPRAIGPWALDSGGFSELKKYGTWRLTAYEYVKEVRRYAEEIGTPDFAAIQDWMCEPEHLKRTRMGVKEHQLLTLENYKRLMDLAPDLPWCPVLQGWETPDYLWHAHQYEKAGFDLLNAKRLGVGSVCRRQGTHWAKDLMTWLWGRGYRNLHFFGMKRGGLIDDVPWPFCPIRSSDSMAWSAEARRSPRAEGCTHPGNCGNCMTYALRWRESLIEDMRKHPSPLWGGAVKPKDA